MIVSGKLKDLTVNRDGTQNVTFTVSADFANAFDSLKDHPVTVEIKKESKGRSLDANKMCWALCSDIGKAMTPPLSKEEVYKTAIKAAGVYWQDDISVFKLDEVRRRWESNGEGWLFEIKDNAPSPGRKLCHLYFGSSTYTVDEMRVLLDWLVDQCEQMQISIPLSKQREEELLERWGHK